MSNLHSFLRQSIIAHPGNPEAWTSSLKTLAVLSNNSFIVTYKRDLGGTESRNRALKIGEDIAYTSDFLKTTCIYNDAPDRHAELWTSDADSFHGKTGSSSLGIYVLANSGEDEHFTYTFIRLDKGKCYLVHIVERDIGSDVEYLERVRKLFDEVLIEHTEDHAESVNWKSLSGFLTSLSVNTTTGSDEDSFMDEPFFHDTGTIQELYRKGEKEWESGLITRFHSAKVPFVVASSIIERSSSVDQLPLEAVTKLMEGYYPEVHGLEGAGSEYYHVESNGEEVEGQMYAMRTRWSGEYIVAFFRVQPDRIAMVIGITNKKGKDEKDCLVKIGELSMAVRHAVSTQ